jgi:hypothetical protein
MVLGSDGNFGIGTTAPSERLHVAGSALIETNLTVSGYTVAQTNFVRYVSATNWVGSWGDYEAFYMGVNSNGNLRVITNAWAW